MKTDPLRDLAGWLEQYRRHWEGKLDDLEAYLAKIQNKGDKQ